MPTKYVSTEDGLPTPSDLIKTLSNSNVQRLDAEVLRVRGVYRCGTKSEAYPDGYYYDKLRDEVTGNVLVLKVPEVWKKSLKNNTPYVLEGTLDRKVTNSFNELGIYLSFRVTKVIGEEAPLIDEKLREAAEILTQRRAKPRRHIQSVVRECFKRNEKPRVAMICPRAGATDADVDRGIEAQRQNYAITRVPVSLLNKTEIIQTLRRLDESEEYDLIAIYRGGGHGLDVFDDNGVARTVVEMKTPVVTAVGHAEDTPFIEMVADQAFPTPTALGHYLQMYAEEIIEDISWLAQYKEDEKRYQHAIRTLKEEQGRRDDKYQQEASALVKDRNDLQTEIKGLYQEKAEHSTAIELLKKRHRRKVVILSIIFLLCGLVVGYGAARVINRSEGAARLAAPTQPGEPAVSPQQAPAILYPQNSNMKKSNGRKREPQ